MDIIFELLVDFLLEGSIEIGTNKKVSRIIRYPLLILVLLLFFSVIIGLFYFGIKIYTTNKIGSIFIIVVAFVLLVGSIIKTKSIYDQEKRK